MQVRYVATVSIAIHRYNISHRAVLLAPPTHFEEIILDRHVGYSDRALHRQTSMRPRRKQLNIRGLLIYSIS